MRQSLDQDWPQDPKSKVRFFVLKRCAHWRRARQAACDALEAAEERLEQALPPLDQNAIAAARSRGEMARENLLRARAEVEATIKSRMPWFDNWYESLSSADVLPLGHSLLDDLR